MKLKNIVKFSILSFMMIFWSCSNESSNESSNSNIIELEKETLIFGFDVAEETIATSGNNWQIAAFVDAESLETIQEINSTNSIDERVFTCDWISVQKIGLTELKIMVTANLTDSDKNVKILLYSGSNQEYLTVEQLCIFQEPDEIKLSKNPLNFGKDKAEETVTALGTEWLLQEFLDGTECQSINDQTGYKYLNGSYHKYLDETVFTYDWVSVQRVGLNGIKVMVSKNNTGAHRDISVSIVHGNYRNLLYISQSEK